MPMIETFYERGNDQYHIVTKKNSRYSCGQTKIQNCVIMWPHVFRTVNKSRYNQQSPDKH